MKEVLSSEKLPIKLWLEDIEAGALAQARNLANLECARYWVAIMPDAHQGFGMPIGGVLATDDMIVPNAVGVDIGCGMAAARLSLAEISVPEIREIIDKIKKVVPLGFAHQRQAQPWDGFSEAPAVPVIQRHLDAARRQLGTLGGGNHFIEVQAGDDGRIWLMVHSGSRNFGLKTAQEYHALAKKHCRRRPLPDQDLAYLPLDSKRGREYFQAMDFCLRFAQANRELIMNRVLSVVADVVGGEVEERINIHHNYAALEEHCGRRLLIHRKGATRAFAGVKGIIPGSMGSDSFIVLGRGNPESFKSCSHGAGRLMGRRQAIRKLDLQTERAKMEGIVHGLKTVLQLEEAPGAYKDIDEVMNNQRDLVEILVRLRPLGVIKG